MVAVTAADDAATTTYTLESMKELIANSPAIRKDRYCNRSAIKVKDPLLQFAISAWVNMPLQPEPEDPEPNCKVKVKDGFFVCFNGVVVAIFKNWFKRREADEKQRKSTDDR